MGVTKRIAPGTVFGKWTVLKDDGEGRNRKAIVQCECGRVGNTLVRVLRRGSTTACLRCRLYGGHPGSDYSDICPDKGNRARLLMVIRSAIRRCTKTSHKDYGHYGGRGIRVYQEWVANRRAFLAYLMTLTGWDNPSLQIDRVDNDGHYEPGNLRFVTASINNLNKSRKTNGIRRDSGND